MPAVLGHPPRDLGLHLDALDRGDDAHDEVDRAQRGGDVTDEVRVPGGVDEVDLVPVDLERRERQRDARSVAVPPPGRSRTPWCRPRPARSGGSPRRRRAAPRRASSCRRRRGRRGRRCGSSRSETSSLATPRSLARSDGRSGAALTASVIVRAGPRVPPGSARGTGSETPTAVAGRVARGGRRRRRWPGNRRGAWYVCSTVASAWRAVAKRHRGLPAPETRLRDRTKRSPTGMLDKRLRSRVSQGLAPIGKGLERAGISANLLTVVGLALLGRHRAADRRRRAALGRRSGSSRAASSTCSTARWPAAPGRRAHAARSSTPSPTGSPTRSCSAASRWYLAGESPYLSMLAFAAAALVDARLVRAGPGRGARLRRARAGSWSGPSAWCCSASVSSSTCSCPSLWLMIVLTVDHRGPAVRQGVAPGLGPPGPPEAVRGPPPAGPAGRRRTPRAGSRCSARWREQRGPEARA